MFCHFINGECHGQDCVKWDHANDKCSEQVIAEMYAQTIQFVAYYKLIWQLQLSSILKDPSIPGEVKDLIRQAEDAATVEAVLREAGILQL